MVSEDYDIVVVDVSYFNNDDGVTVLVAFIDKQRLTDFREDREAALLSTVTNVPDGPDMTHAQRVSDVIGTTDYPSGTRRHIVALGIGSRTRSPLSTLAPATLVRGFPWPTPGRDRAVDSTGLAAKGARSVSLLPAEPVKDIALRPRERGPVRLPAPRRRAQRRCRRRPDRRRRQRPSRSCPR